MFATGLRPLRLSPIIELSVGLRAVTATSGGQAVNRSIYFIGATDSEGRSFFSVFVLTKIPASLDRASDASALFG